MIKINLMPEDFDVRGIIRGNLSVLRSRKLRERLERHPVIEDSIMDCNGMAIKIIDAYSDCEGRMFFEKPNNGILYPIELFFRHDGEIFPEISDINISAEIPNAALKTLDTSVRAYNTEISSKMPDTEKRIYVPQKPERILTLQA